MPTRSHSFLTNLMAMEEKMRRERISNLFFYPFIGDVEMTLLENGQRDYYPSGKIVERLKMPANHDHILIPFEKNLSGDPKFGDANLEGTGEELDYMWLNAYINQMSHVVVKKKGNMDKLRDDRLLKLYLRAQRALTNWFVRWGNANFISALYEGHSWSLTAGITESVNGIGVSGKYHPNLYYNLVSASDGSGSITAIGTEGKNKTSSEIIAKVETDYSNMTLPSTYFFEALAVLCESRFIDRAVDHNGRKMWLLVMSREDYKNCMKQSDFRNTVKEAFSGKGFDSPLASLEAFVYSDFFIVLNNTATRKWDSDTNDFRGDNGYFGLPTYNTSYNNNVMTVLGKGALGYAVDSENDLHFETENYNFKQQSEIAGMVIDGITRADFVDNDDRTNYFATGNSSRTILSTAYSATNQSSLQVVVKA